LENFDGKTNLFPLHHLYISFICQRLGLKYREGEREREGGREEGERREGGGREEGEREGAREYFITQ